MTDDEVLALESDIADLRSTIADLESDYRAYRELVSRWLWLNRIICLALGVALGVGVATAI